MAQTNKQGGDVPTGLDEAVRMFAGYVRGENGFDELDFKGRLIEWHELSKSEVYNSGCTDTAKHILTLFDNQIPEQLKTWLRLEIEDRSKF